MTPDLLVINCNRGELSESIHLGQAVITTSQGKIIAQAGNPHYLTYARSTTKPLQAIAIVEAGAIQCYDLNPSEVSIICSSHNGEQPHIDQVKSLLSKIGMKDIDLHCSIDDTCSGKHVGMLVLCTMLGFDATHYEQLNHPVQIHIAETVASICHIDPLQLIKAIDGCGAPVFGMTLHQLAIGFASLGTPPVSYPEARKRACHSIITSLQHTPLFLAGTDRFDTDLIRATNGSIIGKMGAEGVYAFTVPGQDIGGAIKIIDGAERALYPAVVEILNQLKLLREDELMKLLPYHKPNQINRQGEIVGSIEPQCRLNMIS